MPLESIAPTQSPPQLNVTVTLSTPSWIETTTIQRILQELGAMFSEQGTKDHIRSKIRTLQQTMREKTGFGERKQRILLNQNLTEALAQLSDLIVDNQAYIYRMAFAFNDVKKAIAVARAGNVPIAEQIRTFEDVENPAKSVISEQTADLQELRSEQKRRIEALAARDITLPAASMEDVRSIRRKLADATDRNDGIEEVKHQISALQKTMESIQRCLAEMTTARDTTNELKSQLNDVQKSIETLTSIVIKQGSPRLETPMQSEEPPCKTRRFDEIPQHIWNQLRPHERESFETSDRTTVEKIGTLLQQIHRAIDVIGVDGDLPPETRPDRSFDCHFCGKFHWSKYCSTVEFADRWAFVQRGRRCAQCLRTDHPSGGCRSRKCEACHEKGHHAALCHKVEEKKKLRRLERDLQDWLQQARSE